MERCDEENHLRSIEPYLGGGIAQLQAGNKGHFALNMLTFVEGIIGKLINAIVNLLLERHVSSLALSRSQQRV